MNNIIFISFAQEQNELKRSRSYTPPLSCKANPKPYPPTLFFEGRGWGCFPSVAALAFLKYEPPYSLFSKGKGAVARMSKKQGKSGWGFCPFFSKRGLGNGGVARLSKKQGRRSFACASNSVDNKVTPTPKWDSFKGVAMQPHTSLKGKGVGAFAPFLQKGVGVGNGCFATVVRSLFYKEGTLLSKGNYPRSFIRYPGGSLNRLPLSLLKFPQCLGPKGGQAVSLTPTAVKYPLVPRKPLLQSEGRFWAQGRGGTEETVVFSVSAYFLRQKIHTMLKRKGFPPSFVLLGSEATPPFPKPLASLPHPSLPRRGQGKGDGIFFKKGQKPHPLFPVPYGEGKGGGACLSKKQGKSGSCATGRGGRSMQKRKLNSSFFSGSETVNEKMDGILTKETELKDIFTYIEKTRKKSLLNLLANQRTASPMMPFLSYPGPRSEEPVRPEGPSSLSYPPKGATKGSGVRDSGNSCTSSLLRTPQRAIIGLPGKQAQATLKGDKLEKQSGSNDRKGPTGQQQKFSKFSSIQYALDSFHRSNQDTLMYHKPIVTEGDWVEAGDLLADCTSSVGGELSLGYNILVAYMPWEGYNYEDAILISERLVFDDIYTSIHIERYELETRETKIGNEIITRDIPDINQKEISHLDKNGIARLGSFIKEGDILVGKITPIGKKVLSDYQKLLLKLFEKTLKSIKDSSLRAPKGIRAKVIKIQILQYKKQNLIKKLKKEKIIKKRASLFPSLQHKDITVSLSTNGQQKQNRIKSSDSTVLQSKMDPKALFTPMLKREKAERVAKQPHPVSVGELHSFLKKRGKSPIPFSLTGRVGDRRREKGVGLQKKEYLFEARKEILSLLSIKKKLISSPAHIAGSQLLRWRGQMGNGKKGSFSFQSGKGMGSLQERIARMKKKQPQPPFLLWAPAPPRDMGSSSSAPPLPKGKQSNPLTGSLGVDGFKNEERKRDSFLFLFPKKKKYVVEKTERKKRRSKKYKWFNKKPYLNERKYSLKKNYLVLPFQASGTLKGFVEVGERKSVEGGHKSKKKTERILKKLMKFNLLHQSVVKKFDITDSWFLDSKSQNLALRFPSLSNSIQRKKKYLLSPTPLHRRSYPTLPFREKGLRSGGKSPNPLNQTRFLHTFLPPRSEKAHRNKGQLAPFLLPPTGSLTDLVPQEKAYSLSSPCKSTKTTPSLPPFCIYPIRLSLKARRAWGNGHSIEGPPSVSEKGVKGKKAPLVAPPLATKELPHPVSVGELKPFLKKRDKSPLPFSLKGRVGLRGKGDGVFEKKRQKPNEVQGVPYGNGSKRKEVTTNFNFQSLKKKNLTKFSYYKVLLSKKKRFKKYFIFLKEKKKLKNFKNKYQARLNSSIQIKKRQKLRLKFVKPFFSVLRYKFFLPFNTRGKDIIGSKEKNIEEKKKKKTQPILNMKKKITKKIPTLIHIYLAEKRHIQVGDKMAGRHGNKGIVSQILPRQDMPFLPDGTPIDIVLNPLGVPSRMNVGQIYECLLGLAGKYLGEQYKIFPFDEIYGPEASRSFVYNKLYEARKKTGNEWLFDPSFPGKVQLYDGRTGETFHQSVTVGNAYMLKLVHMVDDKIHCLTPDHEVLTTNGWIPIRFINQENKIATITANGDISYKYPKKVHKYKYNGSLYKIKNQNLNFLVTPEHRMYVSLPFPYGDREPLFFKRGERGNKLVSSLTKALEMKTNRVNFKNYILIKISEIIEKHFKYLKNANWPSKDYERNLPFFSFDLAKIFLRTFYKGGNSFIQNNYFWLTFFGMWITEGTTFMEKITFYSPFTKQIETICDKQLAIYLRSFNLGDENKYLPNWVWMLSKNQAKRLLKAMCLGFGTFRTKSVNYYTKSSRLAEDVMRLALHAGYSANKYIKTKVGNQIYLNGQLVFANFDIWCLSIIKKNNSTCIKKTSDKKEIFYQGNVYCLTVPNETFYLRCNGIPFWTGNSRSTGPYSLVTQQPLRGRSKMGGQRLGEMEVWAIEGYGAAFTLLEMLTIKSDDMNARQTLWSSIIFNKEISIGTPEAFNVLVRELQALCLDIGLFYY